MKSFQFLVLGILCFGSLTMAAPAAEKRCADLGAACSCDEPLNWLQAGGANYGGGVDPTDSEGTGAKECGSVNWDGSGRAKSIPVPNKPATAASSWQYVQSLTMGSPDGDNINWFYGVPTSTSNGTLCTRSYHNHGTLTKMTSPGQRTKVAQWLGNTTNLTQLEWAWDQAGNANQYLRAQSPGTHGTKVSFEDCRGNWCRIEYCLDYNGQNVTWRVRISVVGNPAKTEIIGPVRQANTQPAPLSFGTGENSVAIGDLFSQCDGTNCQTGARYIAFAIQTKVEPMQPYAPATATSPERGFWPGPAFEIEGGGGGALTPQPLGRPQIPELISGLFEDFTNLAMIWTVNWNVN